MLRTELPTGAQPTLVLITIFDTRVNEFRSTSMLRTPEETDLVRVIDMAAALHEAGAAVMRLAPSRERLQRITNSRERPAEVDTGSLADLGDNEIVDDVAFVYIKTLRSGQYSICSLLGDLDNTEVHDADVHYVDKE